MKGLFVTFIKIYENVTKVSREEILCTIRCVELESVMKNRDIRALTARARGRQATDAVGPVDVVQKVVRLTEGVPQDEPVPQVPETLVRVGADGRGEVAASDGRKCRKVWALRVRFQGEVDRLNDPEGQLLAEPPEAAVLADDDLVAAGLDVVVDELKRDRHALKVLVPDLHDLSEVLQITNQSKKNFEL